MIEFVFYSPEKDYVEFDFSDDAFEFMKSIPNYSETALVSLDNLANKLDLKAVLVKDESTRLG
ncbi:MAG: hypothetical protein ACLFPS_04615 [Clostridia bacterium]